MKPIEMRIVTKLTAVFEPTYLQVINESYMHSVPAGSETHFKVVIVTNSFSGKRQVPRHQAIYTCLAEELQNGVHALALHTFSPDEWVANNHMPESPPCMGGSKHDK